MKKAIYAGSFDPFTIGHLDILKKSAKLFDEVHIILGINSKKQRAYPINAMIDGINKTLEEEHITNCLVLPYNGLIAKYCKENGINYTIRGLRNSMDYEYEENIAEINKTINIDLETIYFRTNNSAISSSMVKELYSFGEPIDSFVPKQIAKIINETNK